MGEGNVNYRVCRDERAGCWGSDNFNSNRSKNEDFWR